MTACEATYNLQGATEDWLDRCVSSARWLVTEQGHSRYRKLQWQVSFTSVTLNYCTEYCIRFLCALVTDWLSNIITEPLQSIHHSAIPCYLQYFHNILQWRTQEFCSGGGRGSTNSVEDRENGDLGAVAPLVRGSGGSCNLVQEISFHRVKFS